MSDMGDALNFWERNTGDLPLLSAMPCVYLALSPGSVPVEQLFSTNALPPQLRDPATSINIFIQSLKTHLFNNNSD